MNKLLLWFLKLLTSKSVGLNCGVDEAGRGSWAGPVVASAVSLPENYPLTGLNDSKKLKPEVRLELYYKILKVAEVGVGISTVEEIDQNNILEATFLAMRRAVSSMVKTPQKALIDGDKVPRDLLCPAEAIVKGDSKVDSIAAASIIAKVTRDNHMRLLAKIYPGYGWEKNFGYGVKYHFEALKSKGVTPEHRCSFKPVHNMLC